MTTRSRAIHRAAELPVGHPTRARLLSALTSRAASGFHVALRDLPPFLVKILAGEARYKKADIEVIPSATVDVGIPTFEGNRAYVIAVNLGTERYETVRGDWSGGMGTSAVDRGGTYKLPANGAAIVGEYGGRGSFARLYVNPSNVSQLIPEETPDELSEDEKYALTYIAMFNSRGRVDAFRDKRLGNYGVDNPLVKSLAAKGLVAIRGKGAQVTTKGKNVRKTLGRQYENTW